MAPARHGFGRYRQAGKPLGLPPRRAAAAAACCRAPSAAEPPAGHGCAEMNGMGDNGAASSSAPPGALPPRGRAMQWSAAGRLAMCAVPPPQKPPAGDRRCPALPPHLHPSLPCPALPWKSSSLPPFTAEKRKLTRLTTSSDAKAQLAAAAAVQAAKSIQSSTIAKAAFA